MTAGHKYKTILNISFAVLIWGLFLYFFSRINFIQDDAYITLQYSKNLVNGNGLVFNTGQQVEGFTSFLWVIILTIPYLIKISPELFIQILGVVFGELCLVITYFLTRMIFRGNKFTSESGNVWFYIPSLFLAISGTFYYWSVSGMETLFFTFLCLMGIYYYLKRFDSTKHIYISMIFFTLAFLTRQEAIILIAIIFFYSISEYFASRKNGKKYGTILYTTLPIFLVPAFIFLSFRFLYYGYFLPNTFYAKTGASLDYLKAGIQYTLSFLKIYLIYGSLLLLPLILFFKRELRQSMFFLYGFVIAYIIYIIYVGGDVLAMHRFFIPVLPLIYISVTIFFLFLYQYVRRLIGGMASSIFIILLILSTSIFIITNSFNDAVIMSHKENQFTRKMGFIASEMKREKSNSKKDLLIAASTVGTLKYFSNCNILDMLGLTDSYIAHHSTSINTVSDFNTGWRERNYNADYVLSRKPDYIIFSTEVKPSSYAERALFTQEEFLKIYSVYPLLIDSISTPFYVYKRYPQEIINTKDTLTQLNKNYDPSFVNYYNIFLNEMNGGFYFKHFDQLKESFKKVVENSPSYFGEPYRFMGMIYYIKKDTVKAIDYLQKCIRIDPANLMSRIILYTIAKSRKSEELIKPQELYLKKYYPEIFVKMNNIR